MSKFATPSLCFYLVNLLQLTNLSNTALGRKIYKTIDLYSVSLVNIISYIIAVKIGTSLSHLLLQISVVFENL